MKKKGRSKMNEGNIARDELFSGEYFKGLSLEECLIISEKLEDTIRQLGSNPSKPPLLDIFRACMTIEEFSDLTGQSKDTIRRQIQRKNVLAVKKQNGRYLIPFWQWDDSRNDYIKGLSNLLSSFQPHISIEDQILFMTPSRISRLKHGDWKVIKEASSLGAF